MNSSTSSAKGRDGLQRSLELTPSAISMCLENNTHKIADISEERPPWVSPDSVDKRQNFNQTELLVHKESPSDCDEAIS